MDYSPPGSSVHEILQARILEGVAIPFCWGSSPPRDQIPVSLHWRQILYHLSQQGSQRSPQYYLFLVFTQDSQEQERTPRGFSSGTKGKTHLIYWFLWSCLSSIGYISLSQSIPSCILYLWKLPVIWLPAFPHWSKEYILLFQMW